MKKHALYLVCGILSLLGPIWARAATTVVDLRASEGARRRGADGWGISCLQSTSLPAGTSAAGTLAVGDTLEFLLFRDTKIRVRLASREESPLGGDVFLGEVEGYDGVKNAVVLQTAEGLTVDIQDFGNNRVYSIVSDAEGVSVREFDPTLEPATPSAGVVPKLPPGAQEKDPGAGRRGVARAVEGQSPAVLDVLVAYDKRAAEWARRNGGGITNFATVAVQKMNTVLVNGALASYFRFRLAGVMTVEADGGSDFDGVLDDTCDGTGAWAAVSAKRDAVLADVVTTLIDTGSSSGVCGLGYMLEPGSPGWFSESAYNVCAIRSVAQSHTMTHETGHNLGAGHADKQADSPGPQYHDYSAGYYFKGNDGVNYHTIMAYDSDGYGNFYTEAPFFSSPDRTYKGRAVGDAWHDNARTLRETYAEAAQWRGHTVTFKANGGSCGTASEMYTPRKAYGKLPAATWNGHAFLGWFTQASGGTRVTAQSTVPTTQTRTLYAHWETAEEPLKVWRFYSEKNKGHFFTISEAEKTQLLTTSLTWSFQGGAYRAYKSKAEGTVPLYRFYSEKYKGHFFTRSEAEKNSLIATSTTWKYQGIAFYVYPKAASGRIPVYRFWSDSYKHHFYTASEAEKNNLVATSKTWKYQGIAFWAESLDVAKATVKFNANGGSCGTASKTYTSGKAYGELPAATRNGQAFLGWFTAASGGTLVTPQTVVTGTSTRTLYAHWEEAAEPLKVWRFYSEKNKGHFFTISETEKTQLLTTSPTWSFQGGAYRAYKTKVSGTVPLYRFYSDSYKGHFFTRSESEKNSLVASSKTWKYEGIAYYVYPSAASGRIPVYRFWSDSYRHHFYTANEKEKNSLVASSKIWKYQGIAFWALPTDYSLGPKTLTVHDGNYTDAFVPVYGFYADAYLKCEMVYPAAELGKMKGCGINGMTFYAEESRINWGTHFRVFVKEVTGKTISAYSGPGTIVYEGGLSISGNRMVVKFSKPYVYKGGNLLVGIYQTDQGTYEFSTWKGESVSGASIQNYSYDSLGDIPATQRNFLPKTTFEYAVQAAKSATAVSGSGLARNGTDGSSTNGEGPDADRFRSEKHAEGAPSIETGAMRPEATDAEVTTSDGTDGSAVADGDEGTSWTPEHPESGSWLVLTFSEPLDVAEVTVAGENLSEGTRVLLSEDAETWFEGEGGTAQYVWVAFPPGAEGLKVREVWVAGKRE